MEAPPASRPQLLPLGGSLGPEPLPAPLSLPGPAAGLLFPSPWCAPCLVTKRPRRPPSNRRPRPQRLGPRGGRRRPPPVHPVPLGPTTCQWPLLSLPRETPLPRLATPPLSRSVAMATLGGWGVGRGRGSFLTQSGCELRQESDCGLDPPCGGQQARSAIKDPLPGWGEPRFRQCWRVSARPGRRAGSRGSGRHA